MGQITLAAPAVNRDQKRARDAGDWLPRLNRCWFAARVVAVRRKYGLTIDQREADALERVLTACVTDKLSPPGADAINDCHARGYHRDGLRDCSE